MRQFARSRNAVVQLVAPAFLIATLGTGQSAARADVAQVGDTLNVLGRSSDDDVYIVGVDGLPGIVSVEMNDGPLSVYNGVAHINIDLGGGDNYLLMLQMSITGDVTIVDHGSLDNDFEIGSADYPPNVIGGDLTISMAPGSGGTSLLIRPGFSVQDVLEFGSLPNEFRGRFTADGGEGIDYHGSINATFLHRPTITGFEDDH